MADTTKGSVLITGASTGIGATYADRFARRGHDLVLVARDKARLDDLAGRLARDYHVKTDVMQADLTKSADLGRIEQRLRNDSAISILLNNAGVAASGGFSNPNLDALEDMIRLNVTAVMRLAGAVVPRFLSQGGGSIINVSSVLAIAPEIHPGIYPGTKAFVLTFSQALQTELGGRGLYVQAVMPAATRTEIWERSGMDITALTGVMAVEELVDAALVGFDRKELVTIPPLPDEGQWEAFQAARKAMLPNFRQQHPAARYRT
jgi:uncharacterized protein